MAEVESKTQALESGRLQDEAQLPALEPTYTRLKQAAAIAESTLVQMASAPSFDPVGTRGARPAPNSKPQECNLTCESPRP